MFEKAVPHARKAAAFLEEKEHWQFHDARLWDMRQKRDQQMHLLPEWQALRDEASRIKEHALANLPDYIEQFEANARKNGIHVHWARDGKEHNRIVAGILKARGARSLIKSKSMITDECEMREYLEPRGITVTETDLGERIQQLDNQLPSHVVVPAVQKLTGDVATLFAKYYHTDPKDEDPHSLAEAQRQAARPVMFEADAGMTGGNFLVAETGSFVVCTNEGNADLSANLPNLHIATLGIERIVPRMADLGVFIRLLSRSALGSPITQYTTHFRRPKKGGEMHIILVDNGRVERLGMKDFWTSLKCIRCGACMNTCPVYRRSGGQSYGAVYSGPIGAIIDPTFNERKFSTLPFASTLNGSCTNVCPVKIDIHEQLYKWRRVLAEHHEVPFVKREIMKVAGRLMVQPRLYRLALTGANVALETMPRFILYNYLNPWGRHRENPDPVKETFHSWYLKTYPDRVARQKTEQKERESKETAQ